MQYNYWSFNSHCDVLSFIMCDVIALRLVHPPKCLVCCVNLFVSVCFCVCIVVFLLLFYFLQLKRSSPSTTCSLAFVRPCDVTIKAPFCLPTPSHCDVTKAFGCRTRPLLYNCVEPWLGEPVLWQVPGSHLFMWLSPCHKGAILCLYIPVLLSVYILFSGVPVLPDYYLTWPSTLRLLTIIHKSLPQFFRGTSPPIYMFGPLVHKHLLFWE